MPVVFFLVFKRDYNIVRKADERRRPFLVHADFILAGRICDSDLSVLDFKSRETERALDFVNAVFRRGIFVAFSVRLDNYAVSFKCE